MVAKLKAIKVELQRRMHDRMAEVGAWLRKVVLGYYQYHAVPGNTTQLRIFKRRVCRLWQSVLVRRSQRAKMRWERFNPFCTPIVIHASSTSFVRAVCVDVLVRICAGAISDGRPYRDTYQRKIPISELPTIRQPEGSPIGIEQYGNSRDILGKN